MFSCPRPHAVPDFVDFEALFEAPEQGRANGNAHFSRVDRFGGRAQKRVDDIGQAGADGLPDGFRFPGEPRGERFGNQLIPRDVYFAEQVGVRPIRPGRELADSPPHFRDFRVNLIECAIYRVAERGHLRGHPFDELPQIRTHPFAANQLHAFRRALQERHGAGQIVQHGVLHFLCGPVRALYCLGELVHVGGRGVHHRQPARHCVLSGDGFRVAGRLLRAQTGPRRARFR